MSESSLSYERVERQMAAADIESSGAEVHGILCGLICAGHPDPRGRWLDEMVDMENVSDLLVQECIRSLGQLHDETLAAVTGPDLGFTPFLPEEERSLKIRAAAVSDWSQGFLYGVGLAGGSATHAFSSETQEALSSLSEITRMELDDLQGNEEDEEALMEIAEFIRVAAMLLHAEMATDEKERS